MSLIILLTEYRHNNHVQKQIETLYNKLKQMNVNKLHFCVVGHMVKGNRTLDFTATIDEIDYPKVHHNLGLMILYTSEVFCQMYKAQENLLSLH